MLAVLATTNRLDLYQPVAFAVSAEGAVTIDGISYRLLFPRVPPREAPYVFAATPYDSVGEPAYFEISRGHYSAFSRLFARIINDHPFDLLQ